MADRGGGGGGRGGFGRGQAANQAKRDYRNQKVSHRATLADARCNKLDTLWSGIYVWLKGGYAIAIISICVWVDRLRIAPISRGDGGESAGSHLNRTERAGNSGNS